MGTTRPIGAKTSTPGESAVLTMADPASPSRIRKRPVCFGNPALGTYNGCVYTLEGAADTDESAVSYAASDNDCARIEGAESVDRMVAMVDVPPEQVPEGILHLARSHRPSIIHVRIVIAEPVTDGTDDMDTLDKHNQAESPTGGDAPLHLQQLSKGQKLQLEGSGDLNITERPSRTYLVLFLLSSQNAVEEFVEDLNGKPYTTLDETVVCSVLPVVALQGEGGVSLLNPMFAPSTKSAHGTLEIVPSSSGEEEDGDGSVAASSASHHHHNNNNTRHNAATTAAALGGSHSALTEDPNCAVCLEHMSLDPTHIPEDRTSILTTVCNHTFHLDCLVQWQDSPCPVCRYDHSGLNETLSQCHICGTTERNYVCLICGLISCVGGGSVVTPPLSSRAGSASDHLDDTSCARTSASAPISARQSTAHGTPHVQNVDLADATAQYFHTTHAGQHYDETLHAYALDTETQHVWDFAGQGYVHRLLQNKEDGKLVEVHDPNNTTSQERSLTPGLSDSQEGEVVHRKLEGFASQYYTLLKSQLEQQRTFYEGRLEEIRREFAKKKSDTNNDKTGLIAELRQERKQLSHRLSALKRKEGKVLEDVAFLTSMNESLEANKIPLELKIKKAQREQIDSREMLQKCLPALEEKVTTLMLQLEESLTATTTTTTTGENSGSAR